MGPDPMLLLSAITEARSVVAFTGAGVSTISGIPDFRGKNGLYSKVDAERIFDIDQFRIDPGFYYHHTADLIYDLEARRPSVVHRVLAKLEAAGYLEGVITQNIDLLHTRAGSRNVAEIHGSPRAHRCLGCGLPSPLPFEEVCGIVRSGGLPRCETCGSVLKPDITFFGEALPPAAFGAARALARGADLLLVLGSSLVVYPAASLPELALDRGAALVIVNNQETHLDRRASLRYYDLEILFDYLEERLPDLPPRPESAPAEDSISLRTHEFFDTV